MTAGSEPRESLRAGLREAVRPSMMLPGWPARPRPAGVAAALPMVLLIWMLAAAFTVGLMPNLGIGPEQSVSRSGDATVQACQRSWLRLGMVYVCTVVVTWEDAVALREQGEEWAGPYQMQVESAAPLEGEVVLHHHGRRTWSPPHRSNVRPASEPVIVRWAAVLVSLSMFVTIFGVGALYLAGVWAYGFGNLLFPPSQAASGFRERVRGLLRRPRPQPRIAPHPESAYRTYPFLTGKPPPRPSLPAGHGAVAVRTRSAGRFASRDHDPGPPLIGIDDRPALVGWGEAVVVVPAGRRRVQAQTLTRSETEWAVEVSPGEVVRLAYAASRSPRQPGRLGRPGVRRPGVPRMVATAYLSWLVVQWAAHWIGVSVPVGIALFLAGPSGYIGAVATKVWLDRRTSRRIAGSVAVGPGRAEAGGEPAAPATGTSAIELGCSFRRSPAAGDQAGSPGWVAAPAVRIDGHDLPVSWATWRYFLPAGTHRVELLAPVGKAVQVDVGEEEVRRLDYHVYVEADGSVEDTAASTDSAARATLMIGERTGGLTRQREIRDLPRIPRMRTHPDSPYEMWPEGTTSGLPAGHGGLIVLTRFARWLPSGWLRPRTAQRPAVGIDGRPALIGWGSAQVVLPAGPHLVHVQTIRPEAERVVQVPPGGTVVLEYVAPRRMGWSRGLLGRPGLPPPGTPYAAAAVAILVGWLSLVGLAAWLGGNGPAALLAGLLCPIMVVGLLSTKAVTDRRDRLARVAAQRAAMAVGGSGLDQPHVLGPAAPPAPPAGYGAVVLTSSFQRDMFRDDNQYVFVEDAPHAWVPPPRLRVDGELVPAGWSTWWYPLLPGEHTVELSEPGHATIRADVRAGAVQYLHYHATIRVTVEADPPVPVKTDVTATLVHDAVSIGRMKATGVAHLHATPTDRRRWMSMRLSSRTYVE